MKIERGILIADYNMRLMVMAVGCIHRINYATFFYDNCKVGDRVLGVLIDDHYNICYKFTLKNIPEIIFGFIIPNRFGSYFLVQTINEFHPINPPFDFYLKDYPLGKRINIEADDILSVEFK